ncbi:pilus assembly protein TadG-related protein [Sphingobium yanoikuyae]|jgi:Flp pilus assembly protein TadG|uniref:TadE/TadG family type IV pilus assembly protein n=1 Tax=Sphingobium yanoikuyae TaxID=13690 RepID=UPI003F00DB17
MGKQIKRAMTFLGRLRRNQAGNTLAMVAAAVIPLAGLIGGGVDMSRAYMVRARMQQACDAAALAGRRAMTTASMSANDIKEAKKFFDFNFPQQTFGAASFTPVIQSKPGETTTVQVSADTTIPTTIMRIFGIQTLSLSVNCDSRFDIGNTDVMMVLDTTGSMAYSISDGKGGTTTRLAALQQAVKDFYDTLGPGSDTTGRVRYGFMPYSSTVNVGRLLPTQFLVGTNNGDTWNYNSRRATYYNGTIISSSICYRKYGSNNCRTSASNAGTDSGTNIRPGACSTWGNTAVANSGTVPYTVTRVTYAPYSWNNSTTIPSSGTSTAACIRKETTTTHQSGYTKPTGWAFFQYEYGTYALPVNALINGGSVANPAYTADSPNDDAGNPVPATTTWNGCIEERSTDSTITKDTSTASVPANAFDLQIDTLPDSEATRWRPHWPDVEFQRNGTWYNSPDMVSNGYSACPSQARLLTSYANRTATPSGQPSSFDNYVDNLVAIGGTYHTIGMMWGARFLSPTGIFSANNASAPNGFNISRHIVFMTDGDMSAYTDVYGAWGYQSLDRRDGPSGTDNKGLTDIHNNRLEMMCNAIKSRGITIWVVGFRNASEGNIQTPLQNCATSSNHWMMAYDAATLTQKFKDIAKNIGGLRLSN